MKTMPKEFTKEAAEEITGEVESGCGLDTKRRRQPTDGDSSTEEDSEGAKFVSPDGSTLKSSETEFRVADKKLENGNSAFRDIWDGLQNVRNAEMILDCNHTKVGYGSNLHIDNVENVDDGAVASTDPETLSHGHNEVTDMLKFNASELDLEKVLEEQETHDLFCPNCHSCITKRVILRKRKRRVSDFQYEERPEKLHVRPNIVAASTEVAETSHDDEPDVFRCLSCFSFFIPAGNGFKIFPFLRKRGNNVNVHVPTIVSSGQTSTGDNVNVHVPTILSSGQTSTGHGNWLLSIFKPGSSRINGSETGATQQPQLDVSFGGDHDLVGSTALQVPAPGDIDGSYANIGKLPSDDDDDIMPVNINKPPKSGGIDQNNQGTVGIIPPITLVLPHDNDMIKPIVVVEPSSQGSSQGTVGIIPPITLVLPHANDDMIKPIVVVKPSSQGSSQGTVGIIPPITLVLPHDDDMIKPIVVVEPSSQGSSQGTVGIIPPITLVLPHDDDMIKPNVVVEPSSQGSSQTDLSISISATPPSLFLPLGGDVQINVSNPILVEPRRDNEREVLKSIVYGGLIESITSLGVISSAAGAKTSTLNVVALGLANLIGGFFVILNDLSELRSSAPASQHDEQTGRYWKILGKKSNFGLHATIAIMSYIFFGLLPPIIYGFSFRERDIKEDKMIAVASSSLLCIALLSIGKAHVSEPKSYIKTFLYYLGLGFSASGLSFVAGVLIHRFLDQLGLFEHDHPLPLPPSPVNLYGIFSGLTSRAAQ